MTYFHGPAAHRDDANGNAGPRRPRATKGEPPAHRDSATGGGGLRRGPAAESERATHGDDVHGNGGPRRASDIDGEPVDRHGADGGAGPRHSMGAAGEQAARSDGANRNTGPRRAPGTDDEPVDRHGAGHSAGPRRSMGAAGEQAGRSAGVGGNRGPRRWAGSGVEPAGRADNAGRDPGPQRSAEASANEPVAGRAPRRPLKAEVGVLTMLPVEMRAVVAALKRMYDYGNRRLEHGPPVHEAWLPDSLGRHVRVAAVQAQRPGAGSAALTFRRLVEVYQPETVLLVGIAGGVSPQVAVGDVVLSDQVVYSAPGPTAVGERQALSYRLGDFLVAVPLTQERGNGHSYRLHHGPIGSGDAVVSDAGAEIRRWLTQVRERVLAVETEGAGVARSLPSARDRLTVRGIAATADQRSSDSGRDLAARHAAEVMAMFVPFLHPGR